MFSKITPREFLLLALLAAYSGIFFINTPLKNFVNKTADQHNAPSSTSFHNDIEKLTKEASRDDADAQFLLGLLYKNGLGVKQDYIQAAKLFQKAATQGYTDAQYNLAILYYRGLGVEQDYNKARQWWQKAADLGFTKAEFNLGNLYERG